MHTYQKLALALLIFGFFAAVPLFGMAQQQASLAPVDNATVTLYYYDNVNKTKGAIVPMDDNPQFVNNDPTLAAPGMYTFSRVPTGQWYYLEADHGGNKWYTIFYMEENVGTKTANVHIPPWAPVNGTATKSPAPSAPAIPTATPAITPSPASTRTSPSSPGMAFTAVIIAFSITLSLLAFRRRGDR